MRELFKPTLAKILFTVFLWNTLIIEIGLGLFSFLGISYGSPVATSIAYLDPMVWIEQSFPNTDFNATPVLAIIGIIVTTSTYYLYSCILVFFAHKLKKQRKNNKR